MAERAYKYKRVMVVDDNEVDRYVSELVMEKTGFAEKVYLVESARDALDQLKTLEATPDELPHLIFLDINMPIMSGFDFLDEYQQLSERIRKNCIIMMLTTSLNEKDRERAEDNPFVCRFVNKPLDKDKLEWRNQDLIEKPC